MGLTAVIFLLCTYNYQINAYTSPLSKVSAKLYQREISKLYSANNGNENEENTQSQKLIRLNAMAAKLRAEASALEAEQQIVVNSKLAQTFALLDTNKDGSISLQELKDALATQLESIVSEEQAIKIMKKFDTSGDGAIQLEEFKGIEAFRTIFEKVLSEEKQLEIEATSQAAIAKQTADFAAQRVATIKDQVNSLPPTGSDKIVSLIPYLLPLCDALPYAKMFIQDNNLEQNNPILAFASSIYMVYQMVPFSGLIAFFLFNTIASNLQLNRLVRFNIQQAILLDIALIFPGIIGAVATIIAKQVRHT
jgi:Ca2+-binding EF-hand superfamily protein